MFNKGGFGCVRAIAWANWADKAKIIKGLSLLQFGKPAGDDTTWSHLAGVIP